MLNVVRLETLHYPAMAIRHRLMKTAAATNSGASLGLARCRGRRPLRRLTCIYQNLQWLSPKYPKDFEFRMAALSTNRGLTGEPATGANAYNKYAPDGRLDRQTSSSEPEHHGLLRPGLARALCYERNDGKRGNTNEGGIFACVSTCRVLLALFTPVETRFSRRRRDI